MKKIANVGTAVIYLFERTLCIPFVIIMYQRKNVVFEK